MKDHTITVKSAEALGIPVTATFSEISRAYRSALSCAEKCSHLVYLAYDWLSVRSVLQRKADLEKHQAEQYQKLDEVVELRHLKEALREAQRKTRVFAAHYPVFAGCNIVYHAASGHSLETTASGAQSGLLTTGTMA